jgi:hypothetical protein
LESVFANACVATIIFSFWASCMIPAVSSIAAFLTFWALLDANQIMIKNNARMEQMIRYILPLMDKRLSIFFSCYLSGLMKPDPGR